MTLNANSRRVAGALVFLGTLASMTSSPRAFAEDAAALEQAKLLFSAGAQAYERGQYAVAIQAFEAVYKLAPRPPLLFALAQAERKQWTVNQSAEDLKKAIDYYREYIDAVKEGARRAEAVSALEALDQDVKALDRAGVTATTPKVEAAPTRLMVTSQTPRAVVSLDGTAPSDAPLIADVAPGKHRVHISADGYFEEDKDVVAVSGTLVPFDFTLREQPASVTILGGSGAEVSVDGRPVGALPFARPLELSAGPHLFAITKTGYKAFMYTTSLEHGKNATIPVTFERTAQRVTSFVFMGVGAGALACGGVFTAMAFAQQSKAQSVLDAKARDNISPSDLDTYRSATDARDKWKGVATVTFGASAALLATGAVLYFFDHPALPPAPPPASDAHRKTAPPTPASPPAMDLAAAPLLAPGVYGAALSGVF